MIDPRSGCVGTGVYILFWRIFSEYLVKNALGVRMSGTPAGLVPGLRRTLNCPLVEAMTKFRTRLAKQQCRENRGIQRDPTNCNTTQN
jgi:hypothetical protein